LRTTSVMPPYASSTEISNLELKQYFKVDVPLMSAGDHCNDGLRIIRLTDRKEKSLRRIYIPKENGKQRPISIPSLEDKIVQKATGEVLNAIYERTSSSARTGFDRDEGRTKRWTKWDASSAQRKWIQVGVVDDGRLLVSETRYQRGTGTSTETRSRRIESMRSDGFSESRKTTVAARMGGTNTPSIWPNTWLSGSRFKNRTG
jgi:hypothetical protein